MGRKTAGLTIEVDARADLNALVQLFEDTAGLIPLSWAQVSAFYGAIKQSYDDAAELVPLIITGSLLDAEDPPNAVTPDDGWVLIQAARADTAAIQTVALATVSNIQQGVLDIFASDAVGQILPWASGRALLYSTALENLPA